MSNYNQQNNYTIIDSAKLFQLARQNNFIYIQNNYFANNIKYQLVPFLATLPAMGYLRLTNAVSWRRQKGFQLLKQFTFNYLKFMGYSFLTDSYMAFAGGHSSTPLKKIIRLREFTFSIMPKVIKIYNEQYIAKDSIYQPNFNDLKKQESQCFDEIIEEFFPTEERNRIIEELFSTEEEN